MATATALEIVRRLYPDAGEHAEGLAGLYDRFIEHAPHSFDVGRCWYALLVELDRALADLQPDYKLYQVKEKFGGLRYACENDGSAPVRALIRAAAEKASRTCEVCGSTGEDVTTDGPGWITTRCVACRQLPTQLGCF